MQFDPTSEANDNLIKKIAPSEPKPKKKKKWVHAGKKYWVFLPLKNSFFPKQCDKAQLFNNAVLCYALQLY